MKFKWYLILINNYRALAEKSYLAPVYSSLIGYLHQQNGNIKDALTAYSKSGILIDQKRLMRCILYQFKVFHEQNNSDIDNTNNTNNNIPNILSSNKESKLFIEAVFVSQMMDLNNVCGLQAYRLLTELLYRQFITKLLLDQNSLDNSLTLRSFRIYPGSQRNGMSKNTKHGFQLRTR